jgi:hypothetical protein
MKLIYDIFRELPGSEKIWIEAVEDLENARARLLSILKTTPGDYYVYDLTRNKIVLQARA